MDSRLDEPWTSFLADLDEQLTRPTALHCVGGFVIAACYGLSRPTGDIDVLDVLGTDRATLEQLAGRGSALDARHEVHLQFVGGIAELPESYEDRLTEVFEGRFNRLHLFAVERHDLALSKLVRNDDRDREDVRRLAAGPGLDVAILRRRYDEEMIIRNPEREGLTLDLWVEMIEEIQQKVRPGGGEV